MTIGIRRPWEAVDYEQLVRYFPPAPDYFESAFFAEPEQIERVQLARARQRAERAAAIPFYQRLWGAAGVTPADLRTLDDLTRFPAYTVEDIRVSLERNPPWGDYQGVAVDRVLTDPARVYFSGGTTGKARPTLYTQWDREVSALLAARVLHRQGVRPGDVVLNSYQYSTFNGGALFDEAAHRWLNCVVITTSSGNVTASEKQAQLALDHGATAILTTGDHLLRIAEVCEKMGVDPARDLRIQAVGGMGDIKTPQAIAEIIGRFGVAEYYESYGFHEVGLVSVECPEHQGLHVFEDAFVVQIVDPETGDLLPDGEPGAMVVTELFKTGSAQFRYDTLDLSFLYPREQCRCGSWTRRMGRFSGRADNMVKLRGVNVWPEAVGTIACAVDGVEPDYLVTVTREGERDVMRVSVVSGRGAGEFPAIAAAVEQALQHQIGLRIEATVVAPGELDELTEVRTQGKPKRFRDERPNA